MRYFIVNVAMHLVITGIFIMLTCIAAGRNRRKKTKHAILYFFPIIFALAAIAYIVKYTAPRLMDINSMINGNYYYDTGTVEKIGFMKNYFVIDGQHYFLNPIHNSLQEGDTVRVKHTPYSSFTVEIKTVEETQSGSDEDASKENG
ncbi:MAG: hypothetical protein IKT10_00565 [Clostridiales bacterium]|nr:hypothetical protein [Clostridiales bacterium]